MATKTKILQFFLLFIFLVGISLPSIATISEDGQTEREYIETEEGFKVKDCEIYIQPRERSLSIFNLSLKNDNCPGIQYFSLAMILNSNKTIYQYGRNKAEEVYFGKAEYYIYYGVNNFSQIYFKINDKYYLVFISSQETTKTSSEKYSDLQSATIEVIKEFEAFDEQKNFYFTK